MGEKWRHFRVYLTVRICLSRNLHHRHAHVVSVHVIFKIPLEFWMSDEFFIGVHSRAWVCPCRSSEVSITWWKSWKRFPREGDSISSHSQSVWENSSQQSLQLIQGKGFYMYCKAQGLNLLRSLSDRKLNGKKQGPLNYFDCPLDFVIIYCGWKTKVRLVRLSKTHFGDQDLY